MSKRGNYGRRATADKSVREPSWGRKQVQIGKAVKLSDDNSSIFVLENTEHSTVTPLKNNGIVITRA